MSETPTRDIMALESAARRKAMKAAWQRRKRDEFKAQHGYSQTADYSTGQLRAMILDRDGYRCVHCGMTDAEHKATWGRPITLDHIDMNRRHNEPSNLRTLCLRCHSNKTVTQQPRRGRVPEYRVTIIAARVAGRTYQAIADELGFSIGAIWKWVQRWRAEEANGCPS